MAFYKDDPERALHSALEMMKVLLEFNREKGKNPDLHFGVNIVLVIVGNI